MAIEFTKEQEGLLHQLQLSFELSHNLSVDQIFEIDEKLSDYYLKHGVDEEENMNDVGLLCESIIENISAI